MTDKEIIKALGEELKTALIINHRFEESNDTENPDDHRFIALLSRTIDLINHQQAEIERLKQENKEYCEANRIIAYQRNQRDVEIQALHNELNGLNFMEQQIKSEAVREFAERLKKRNDDFCVDKSDMAFAVDSIVKEMVGDTE